MSKFTKRPAEPYHRYLLRLSQEASLIQVKKQFLEAHAALLIHDAEDLTKHILAAQGQLKNGQGAVA